MWSYSAKNRYGKNIIKKGSIINVVVNDKKSFQKIKRKNKKREHFYKKSVIMNLHKQNNGGYKNALN